MLKKILSRPKILTMTSLVLLTCISLGINQLSAVKSDKCEGCPLPDGEPLCIDDDIWAKNSVRCSACCEEECIKQEKDYKLLICEGVCDDDEKIKVTCKCTTAIP